MWRREPWRRNHKIFHKNFPRVLFLGGDGGKFKRGGLMRL
jgi:hypothetical protein